MADSNWLDDFRGVLDAASGVVKQVGQIVNPTVATPPVLPAGTVPKQASVAYDTTVPTRFSPWLLVAGAVLMFLLLE
jgi:hypothetical protein